MSKFLINHPKISDSTDWSNYTERFFPECSLTSLKSEFNTKHIWKLKNFPDSDLFSDESIKGRDIFVYGYFTEIGNNNAVTNLKNLISSDDNYGSISDLNGSFTIIDIESTKIKLISDRWASRSVWYDYVDGGWVFSSHPFLIWKLKKKLEILPESLTSFLIFGKPVGNLGLFSGVRRVAAGEILTLYPNGKSKHEKWFCKKHEPLYGKSSEYWAQKLHNAILNSSSRIKSVSRKPLLFLSGGLDSRFTAGVLSQNVSLSTLTLADLDNIESFTSSKVSKLLGTNHRFIKRTPDWHLDHIRTSSIILGGTYHWSHAHFSKAINTLADSLEFDTVFLGDFSEAFQKTFGHSHLIRSFDLKDVLSNIISISKPYNSPNFIQSLSYLKKNKRIFFIKKWLNSYSKEINDAKFFSIEKGISLDYLLRWSSSYRLPTYSMIEDVRQVSNERNLIFDNEIHDLLLQIPEEERSSGLIMKNVLKKIDKELLNIPNSSKLSPLWFPTSVTKFLMKLRKFIGILRRKLRSSVGLETYSTHGAWPSLQILMKKEPWKSYIQEHLLHEDSFPEDIFDTKKISEAWFDYLDGKSENYIDIQTLLTLSFCFRHVNYK